MSYLVMARRWRPQQFSDVVGQDHVTQTLQQAIKRGRVAHAYIFTGPRGVGKTTSARLLAKAVNCTDLQTSSLGLPEPCNKCHQCLDIGAAYSLDVIEIDGASNNRVEDVRNLRENIKFAPSALAKKVYIIDEVHMLSTAAFNALLKTLEEPPDHAMFIFATTEIHKVPATVLSRCQRFDFKRISTREIRNHIETIVKGDKITVDDTAMVAIAVKAEGALRDALSILDQLVAYQGDEPITGDIVRQALGLIDTDLFFAATDLAATGRVHLAIELADMLAGGGHDPREFLHGFQRHLMNLLFIRAGGKPEELDIAESFYEKYISSSTMHTDEDFLRMADWASQAEDLLRDALDPQLRLELFLVKIARMDRAVDIGLLLQSLGAEPESYTAEEVRGPVSKAKVESPAPAPVNEPAAAIKVKKDTETAKPDSTDAAENDVTKGPDEPEEPDEPDTPDDPPPPNDPAPTATPPTPDKDDSPPAKGPESDSPENEPQLTLMELRERWEEFCDNAHAMRASLGSTLQAGAPISLNNGSLEITWSDDESLWRDKARKNLPIIEKAFEKTFGTKKRVSVIAGNIPKGAAPLIQKTQSEQNKEELTLVLEDRPVWKHLVERLDLKLKD